MKKLISRLKSVEHAPRSTQVSPLIEMVRPIEETGMASGKIRDPRSISPPKAPEPPKYGPKRSHGPDWLKAVNAMFKMGGKMPPGEERDQFFNFMDLLHGKVVRATGKGAEEAKKQWDLLSKKLRVYEAAKSKTEQDDEEEEDEPLKESDTVYWKSVKDKFPVSKKGDSYYAKMPDGEQKVDWKPEEEAEAKKHLDGLLSKDESAGLKEQMSREAGVLNAKDPKVEFLGVRQLPGGKLGLVVSLNGMEYLYAPMEQQKQPEVGDTTQEAFALGRKFLGLLDESPGTALVWLRYNAELFKEEKTR